MLYLWTVCLESYLKAPSLMQGQNSPCVHVHLLCMGMSLWACVPTHTHLKVSRTVAVSLHRFLPSCLETGSLTGWEAHCYSEPGLWDLRISALPSSAGARSTHRHAWLWGFEVSKLPYNWAVSQALPTYEQILSLKVYSFRLNAQKRWRVHILTIFL